MQTATEPSKTVISIFFQANCSVPNKKVYQQKVQVAVDIGVTANITVDMRKKSTVNVKHV